jgi:hypothetical protein
MPMADKKKSQYLTKFDKKLVQVTPEDVDAAVEAANELRAAGEIEGVNIFGFVDVPLSALAKLAPMSRIHLQRCQDVDLEPLYGQAQLDSLVIGGDPVRVDLARFASLRHLSAFWHPKSAGLAALRKVRKVSLWKTGDRFRDIASLELSPTVSELSLTQSRLSSLAGIEQLPKLEELQLAYLRAPMDLSAVAQAGKLRVLYLGNIPKPLYLEAIGKCARLEILNVQSCGEFDTLHWMKGLEALDTFVFLGTRVKDCDFSVLTKLPILSHFGVDYRREFKPALKELKALLKAKIHA